MCGFMTALNSLAIAVLKRKNQVLCCVASDA